MLPREAWKLLGVPYLATQTIEVLNWGEMAANNGWGGGGGGGGFGVGFSATHKLRILKS